MRIDLRNDKLSGKYVKIPYIARVDDNSMGFVTEWKEGFRIFLMDKRLFVLTLAATICMVFFIPGYDDWNFYNKSFWK